jgi:hypothetical protein
MCRQRTNQVDEWHTKAADQKRLALNALARTVVAKKGAA